MFLQKIVLEVLNKTDRQEKELKVARYEITMQISICVLYINKEQPNRTLPLQSIIPLK